MPSIPSMPLGPGGPSLPGGPALPSSPGFPFLPGSPWGPCRNTAFKTTPTKCSGDLQVVQGDHQLQGPHRLQGPHQLLGDLDHRHFPKDNLNTARVQKLFLDCANSYIRSRISTWSRSTILTGGTRGTITTRRARDTFTTNLSLNWVKFEIAMKIYTALVLPLVHDFLGRPYCLVLHLFPERKKATINR